LDFDRVPLPYFGVSYISRINLELNVALSCLIVRVTRVGILDGLALIDHRCHRSTFSLSVADRVSKATLTVLPIDFEILLCQQLIISRADLIPPEERPIRLAVQWQAFSLVNYSVGLGSVPAVHAVLAFVVRGACLIGTLLPGAKSAIWPIHGNSAIVSILTIFVRVAIFIVIKASARILLAVLAVTFVVGDAISSWVEILLVRVNSNA